MDYQTSLSRFLTAIPERYEVAQGLTTQINAVDVEIDIKSGKALSINRIFCKKDNIEKEEESEKEN
jgi:calcineurin-like phosphoesterase